MSTTEPKVKGVENHYGKLRLWFYYEGKRHREPLNLEPTPENYAKAAQQIAAIREQIRLGTFDYAAWFPDAWEAKQNKFAVWKTQWLEIKRNELAPSTYRSYEGYLIREIAPEWDDTTVSDIDYLEAKRWLSGLTHLASKTQREVAQIMSQILELYRTKYPAYVNPMKQIRVPENDETDPDPFTPQEIKKIITCQPKESRYSEGNMAAFALHQGPRPSELIALGWDDIDLKTGRVKFARACVDGQYKVTKTKRSTRDVELLDESIYALQRQYEITGQLPPIVIEVLGRDNRTLKKIKFRPVWINTSTGRPYTSVSNYNARFWQSHLKKAGVRYRPVGQCRHTFASIMMSLGMDLSWIINQMGHTTEAMLRKRYGKYMNLTENASKASDLLKQLQN